jgi:alpha-1,6-mannosyltransferase
MTSSSALPRVVDVSMFWGPAGGVRRTIAAKHAHLPAHGLAHRIVAPGVHGPDTIDCGGVRLPASGGYRFVLSRRRAAALIDAAAPDLIESADPYRLAWSCLDVARQRGIACLAFCHSNLPLVAGRRFGVATERVVQRYLVHLYSQFDAVLAPSRTMLDALRGWGVDRTVLQPLGVDSRVFHPGCRDERWRHDLLRTLQRPPQTRLLVYAGRFAAEKNLDLLAQASTLLGPRCLLLLLGDGPRPPRGPHLHLLGTERDDAALARVLASCDAFVHAGDQETFGLAALEAMACGTPIVVSARQGLGELAQGVGQTVDSQRAQLWAEAIAAALDSTAPAPTEAALARARALDWSLVVARMAQRYAGWLMHPAPAAAFTPVAHAPVATARAR